MFAVEYFVCSIYAISSTIQVNENEEFGFKYIVMPYAVLLYTLLISAIGVEPEMEAPRTIFDEIEV